MKLNNEQNKWLRKIQHKVMAFIYRKDLRKLATLYGTDKWNYHWYAQHYNRHFTPLRLKKLKVLEIGIGGYDDPNSGGESLRMWKTFFPNSTIFGIDVVDKTSLEEKRIKIFHGSQSDEEFLHKVISEIGKLDIIIDDGSHVNGDVIKSFNILFTALNDGGFYVIEDTLFSYLPSLGDKWLKMGREDGGENWWAKLGGSIDLNDSKTMMNFFKRLVDGLNYQEILQPGYSPSYFDKHIVAIHFYHNLVILSKGNNNEESSFLEKNTLKPSILKQLGIDSLEDLGINFAKNSEYKNQ